MYFTTRVLCSNVKCLLTSKPYLWLCCVCSLLFVTWYSGGFESQNSFIMRQTGYHCQIQSTAAAVAQRQQLIVAGLGLGGSTVLLLRLTGQVQVRWISNALPSLRYKEKKIQSGQGALERNISPPTAPGQLQKSVFVHWAAPSVTVRECVKVKQVEAAFIMMAGRGERWKSDKKTNKKNTGTLVNNSLMKSYWHDMRGACWDLEQTPSI